MQWQFLWCSNQRISSTAVRVKSQMKLHKLLYAKMVILNTGILLPFPRISGGNLRVQITTTNIWQTQRCTEMLTKLEKYNIKHVKHFCTVHILSHPPTEKMTNQPTNQPNKQTNKLTHSLTTNRRVLEKLRVSQTVRKFLAFYKIWRTERTKDWNFVIANYKNIIKTHVLLNYTVSFYARVMFLKNMAQTEHKFPFKTVYFLGLGDWQPHLIQCMTIPLLETRTCGI